MTPCDHYLVFLAGLGVVGEMIPSLNKQPRQCATCRSCKSGSGSKSLKRHEKAAFRN